MRDDAGAAIRPIAPNGVDEALVLARGEIQLRDDECDAALVHDAQRRGTVTRLDDLASDRSELPRKQGAGVRIGIHEQHGVGWFGHVGS